MNPLAAQLWTATWQGAIFIGVIWITCRLVKNLSPTVRYWLWWIACAKLLLGLLPIAPVELRLLRAEEPASLPITTNLARVEPPSASSTPVANPVVPAPSSQTPDLATIVVAIWVAGFLVKCGIAIHGGIKLRQVIGNAKSLDDSNIAGEARQLGAHMGLHRLPKLVESTEIRSPMVAGILRPVIVLPVNFGEDFSPEELRMALTHELAHIRRRDILNGLVPTLAEAAFYFLPLVKVAYSEWVTEREAACDEEALRQTGARPSEYGELLLRLVTRDSSGRVYAAAGATASYHTLKRRLTLMKAQPQRPLRLGAFSVIAALALLIPWTVTAQSNANPKNLLRNSSLETNTENWVQGPEVEGVRFSRSESVSHKGKGSLCLSKSSEKYFPVAQWSQPFHHDGKSKYLKVTAWVKAIKAFKAVIEVQCMKDGPDGTKQMVHKEWSSFIGARNPGDPAADHDWKEYTGTVEIAEGTQDIVIALQDYGPGTVWFDDIVAEYTDQAPEQAPKEGSKDAGPNVVKNSGFEDGLTAWSEGAIPGDGDVSNVSMMRDNAAKHGGNVSLCFSKSENRFFPVKMLYQTLPFEQGKYRKAVVSVWVKAQDVNKAAVALIWDMGTDNGNSQWCAYIGKKGDTDPPANHDWKKYTETLDVPTNASTATIAAEMYGPGKVWFDDLEVSFK